MAGRRAIFVPYHTRDPTARVDDQTLHSENFVLISELALEKTYGWCGGWKAWEHWPQSPLSLPSHHHCHHWTTVATTDTVRSQKSWNPRLHLKQLIKLSTDIGFSQNLGFEFSKLMGHGLLYENEIRLLLSLRKYMYSTLQILAVNSTHSNAPFSRHSSRAVWT